MSKERCARKILEKLGSKPYEIAFPPQVEGFLKTVRSLPRSLSFPLAPLVHQEDGGVNEQDEIDLPDVRGLQRLGQSTVYAAAAELGDAEYRADHGAFFGSVHGTLNHLLVGDRIWMQRLTGEGVTAPARIAEDARIVAFVDGLSDRT